ncbi:retrovirus-related pol polyprotein from transposon TNT 1-94 [Tanacetum coccineum]
MVLLNDEINRSIVYTRHNKTPYELIRGRKPNIQYFHVFGSLCYLTNDRDDLGKMKPKADIGIFIDYSESSREFRIYNRRTKNIMETIHVKFDELTPMASECNNSKPRINNTNFQDSSEEYYATKSPEVSENSAANTLDNENTSSSSLIVAEEDEAPQIVSSSAEQVATEPNSSVLNENADELVQEDVTEFDINVFYYPPQTPIFEEAESSSIYQASLNMHDEYSRTKKYQGNYVDASCIESMQDELNQFKRLNVWELVECPIGKNITAVKWIWKNKTDVENTVIRNKFCLVSKGYAFLNGPLKVKFFVHQPDGFVDPDYSNHVYILKKALYGLKQALKAWSTKPVFSTRFSKLMKDNFEMSMIGEMKFFLGLQARPTEKHLKEVKRIFRYIRQTINMALWYSKDFKFELIVYSDADLAGCNDDCKSTSGGIQFLGDKLVSWSLKKQDCTAMSTAKAEYVSLSACCAQVIWIRTQLLDYGFRYNKIPMYCDSQSVIAISCNPVQHSRTKHINIRYHFIKEHVEKGTTELCFVRTEYQLADLFRKALPKERFEYLVHRIGMRFMTQTKLERLAKLSS